MAKNRKNSAMVKSAEVPPRPRSPSPPRRQAPQRADVKKGESDVKLADLQYTNDLGVAIFLPRKKMAYHTPRIYAEALQFALECSLFYEFAVKHFAHLNALTAFARAWSMTSMEWFLRVKLAAPICTIVKTMPDELIFEDLTARVVLHEAEMRAFDGGGELGRMYGLATAIVHVSEALTELELAFRGALDELDASLMNFVVPIGKYDLATAKMQLQFKRAQCAGALGAVNHNMYVSWNMLMPVMNPRDACPPSFVAIDVPKVGTIVAANTNRQLWFTTNAYDLGTACVNWFSHDAWNTEASTLIERATAVIAATGVVPTLDARVLF